MELNYKSDTIIQ